MRACGEPQRAPAVVGCVARADSAAPVAFAESDFPHQPRVERAARDRVIGCDIQREDCRVAGIVASRLDRTDPACLASRAPKQLQAQKRMARQQARPFRAQHFHHALGVVGRSSIGRISVH